MLRSSGTLRDSKSYMVSRISGDTRLVSFIYTMLYIKPTQFPSGHTAKPNFLTVCSKDETWLNSGQRDICRFMIPALAHDNLLCLMGWSSPLPVRNNNDANTRRKRPGSRETVWGWAPIYSILLSMRSCTNLLRPAVTAVDNLAYLPYRH